MDEPERAGEEEEEGKYVGKDKGGREDEQAVEEYRDGGHRNSWLGD